MSEGKDSEPLLVPGRWDIEYKYAAGEFAARFLRTLKEKKILGVRCPSCRRVLMPPRKFCERCLVENDNWVELRPEGVLMNFIIVYRKFYGLPDPPYAIGLVKLDGSDDSILHFIGGVDLSSPAKALTTLKPGIRVTAVWAETRNGSILDIRHFEPLIQK